MWHLLDMSVCQKQNLIVMYTQILSEIMENGIHIYTGQIDEEEDSDEVKELRVRDL